MAQNKTTETTASVKKFLDTVADETKRTDSFRITEILKEQSGYEPKMWGPAIIGFGSYHYCYESGREGDAPLVGFAPRKKDITLYLSSEFPEREKLLKQFGKHSTGKSCIYIKKLADIDEGVLRKMVDASLKYTRANKTGC